MYPFLFANEGEKRAFADGTNEAPAHGLYGEIPSTFPTVLGQVDMLPHASGKLVDIALVTGGINDVGPEDIIDPQVHTGRYIESYDGYIRRIVEDNVFPMLKAVRAKCPTAIIMYFGFYSGLSYSSNTGKIRELFKHEYNDDFKWWFNQNVYTEIDVNKMINEAQTRAEWFNGRWQYWIRRAINLMNQDVELRASGVIFVPSQFADNEAGFAPLTKLWEDYTDPTGDPARADRVRLIPRIEHLQDMRTLLFAAFLGGQRALAQQLDAGINGPATLKRALAEYAGGGDNRTALIASLSDEIHRIQHGLIASMAHPNARGSQSYANRAINLYREHLATMKAVAGETGGGTVHPVAGALGRGLPVPPPIPNPGTPLSDTLVKYKLRSRNSLAADVTHLNVDSLAITIKTASNSSRNLSLPASLVLTLRTAGGVSLSRVFLLTFGNYVNPVNVILGDGDPVGKPYPYLEPGTNHRFTTVTTEGAPIKLEEIVGCTLSLGPDPLKGTVLEGREHGTVWAPESLALEVNGVWVNTVNVLGTKLGPRQRVDLCWPQPLPAPKFPFPKIPKVKRVRPLGKVATNSQIPLPGRL
ncbi:hypothetical protein [Arthrobacter sp. ok909]|uniref:hypothetical protein n=1 Tax=Arthrobacter sp. ok909 TaxID=1761746 RepID=UPI001113B390|nr:hypothetical protein [Arthrobacter sp. ok909]